jgi:hypothetical protein
MTSDAKKKKKRRDWNSKRKWDGAGSFDERLVWWVIQVPMGRHCSNKP